jgi:lipoyl(octanoyl) transferase
MTSDTLITRYLGCQDYLSIWQDMQHFTDQRDEDTPDEIWVVEHPPIFTQGQNGKAEQILSPGNIKVIKVDRGGQVTYHGPGQLLAYTLIDLKRKKLNVRQMVSILEDSVVHLLSMHGIQAATQCKAPGVYVNGKKIASVGLRIRRGCSFHGLALNVAMDLEPFTRINPCGFMELEMTQISDFDKMTNINAVATELVGCLITNLGYTNTELKTGKWHGSKKHNSS